MCVAKLSSRWRTLALVTGLSQATPAPRYCRCYHSCRLVTPSEGVTGRSVVTVVILARGGCSGGSRLITRLSRLPTQLQMAFFLFLSFKTCLHSRRHPNSQYSIPTSVVPIPLVSGARRGPFRSSKYVPQIKLSIPLSLVSETVIA